MSVPAHVRKSFAEKRSPITSLMYSLMSRRRMSTHLSSASRYLKTSPGTLDELPDDPRDAPVPQLAVLLLAGLSGKVEEDQVTLHLHVLRAQSRDPVAAVLLARRSRFPGGGSRSRGSAACRRGPSPAAGRGGRCRGQPRGASWAAPAQNGAAAGTSPSRGGRRAPRCRGTARRPAASRPIAWTAPPGEGWIRTSFHAGGITSSWIRFVSSGDARRPSA